jgi:twitching motility two-component system response regulator PilH
MALILIVDDSPTEVHVMQKALERHGYRTAWAGDGAEGIRLARQMHPDLIFMDIVMPGMNGYQATRTLLNDPNTKQIPIVMVCRLTCRRVQHSRACAIGRSNS